MNKVVLCLVGFLWFVSYISVSAQDMRKDTVDIEEVVVNGKSINRYQTGSKVETISSEQLETMQDGNLEQVLLRYTPIYVKSMAGSLGTIRMRGTSPDHTSINFGGININSLTLGHSNVSNVPMYLFDKIKMQYGSSSVENGSGSIGGAIFLGLDNRWKKGIEGEARVAHGSFGEQLYGTKLFYGDGKWEGVTRAYLYVKKNDFPFFNNTPDFEKESRIFGEDRQHNAAIENKGLIQEINRKFSSNEMFKLKIWLEQDWHQVQHNAQTNAFQPKFIETLEDKHVRVWVEYNNNKKRFKYTLGGGYVYDNSIFDHTAQEISTQRIIGTIEGNYKFSSLNGCKIGIKYKSIFPDVHAYNSELLREDWVDNYLSYYHYLLKKLLVTINMRQAYVTDFEAPITPSIGFSYSLFSSQFVGIKVTGNVSKSYRIPTFNDRYWIPGGNPDLKPERGTNYELGSKFSYYGDSFKGTFQVNAFLLTVENWLLWVSGNGVSKAQNVLKVESKGLELQTDWEKRLGEYVIKSGINYTYNPAVRKEENNEVLDGEVDKKRQLEYVPLHRGVLFFNGCYKKVDIGLDVNYTHELYYLEEDVLDKVKKLPNLVLFNSYMKYRHNLKSGNSFRFIASLNNIFNKDYQSTMGYPMPGINWRFSVTYNFK